MKRSGLPANAFLRSQERDRVRPSSDRVTARAKATAQLLGHSTRSARAGDVGLISGALWFSACSAAPCTMPPSADRAGLCTVTRSQELEPLTCGVMVNKQLSPWVLFTPRAPSTAPPSPVPAHACAGCVLVAHPSCPGLGTPAQRTHSWARTQRQGFLQ